MRTPTVAVRIFAVRKIAERSFLSKRDESTVCVRASRFLSLAARFAILP